MSRNFLCRCEDIDTDEIDEAIQEGHDDLESLRRYTAIGTGPCQGKACIQETIRLLAGHHEVPEEDIGQMTLRPPFAPVPLGMLAALAPEALEQLLGGQAQEHARTTRQALEDDREPRTGRTTPASRQRNLADHHREQATPPDTDGPSDKATDTATPDPTGQVTDRPPGAESRAPRGAHRPGRREGKT